jgi:hypothetical protein
VRIAKSILTIIVLLPLNTTVLAVEPGKDHVVCSTRSATVPKVPTEALATSLREWLIQEIPDPLFEDEPGWGRTAPVATGVQWKGKGLHGHPEIVRQDKNQGTWRKIRVSAVNLPSSMVVDIRNIQKLDQGRTQFDVLISFDARMDATQQNWSKGVKLYDGNLRARLRIRINLHCEVTARMESKEALLLDMIFRLRVIHADANYDHFVTEHIAGLAGDAARLLGDTLQKVMHHSLEKQVLSKANTAIVKAADTKDIRLSLVSVLK